MPILHAFSELMRIICTRIVAPKSVPIRIFLFWMIVHNWLFLLSIPLGFSLLSPLVFLYILNNLHKNYFRINYFLLFLLKMPSYKTDWLWKSWNLVIRNHTFGNSSIYYIHTLSKIIFLITYLFSCSCEFYGISGEQYMEYRGIHLKTLSLSLIYIVWDHIFHNLHCNIFVIFKHVFMSLFCPSLIHSTGSLVESMF